MNILVVYDSVFGNTKELADRVAEALGGKAVRPSEVNPAELSSLELVIAASPTRAFSPMPSIKQWIQSLPAGSLKGVSVAVFDTRVSLSDVDSKFLVFMANRFGYAAEKLARALKKKGGTLVSQPQGFIVSGNEGPMKDGEADRAAAWAATLEIN